MLQLSISKSAPDSVVKVLIGNKFRVRVPSVTTRRMTSFLEDPEFQADLRSACRRAIRRYGQSQSSYQAMDDLQQDVLVKFIKWLPQYRGHRKCGPILFKIATNLMIDALRRERGMSRVNADVDWENTDIDSLKSTGRELDTPLLLEECLKTLSEVDRKIFIEYSLKNRTSYEVAEEVNLSRQTITKRLKKALAKLEECLGR